jgi:tRNA(Arg) A34 adenosine deaminase TadA
MSDDLPTELDAAVVAGHLRRAVALAHEARARGDRPFGAVLLDAAGEVVAEGRNAVTTTGDVRAHAELDAIEAAREAGTSHRVAGGTVLASGEPCPMCAAGMVWAGIARIVFAAAGADIAALAPSRPRFNLSCADVVAASGEAVLVRGPVDGVGALDPFRG